MILDNYKTNVYYRVEMTNGSGYMPDKFDTYKDAYVALCEAYIKDIQNNYKPIMYKIVKYNEVFFKDEEGNHHNVVSLPVWSD